MKKIRVLLFLFSGLGINGTINAQSHASIPAFTAYALPAEEGNDDDESNLFSQPDGLHNWTNAKQEIRFYFNLRNTGQLNLALLIKNDVAGNIITVAVGGKKFTLAVPKSASFKKLPIGSITIQDSGFYTLSISAATKKGEIIAAIKSLELSGAAIKNIHFNTKSRRNAASVHLMYPLDDSMQVVSFYNEITVPKDADPLHSYFMACGFAKGYFGMQVNSATERRIIFSVWDSGNEATDRKKVAAENRVQLMGKGENVFADDFGNEGTGGHSHWLYNWKPGTTYKFLVTAAIDSAAATTSYAGYFFIPEEQRWKLIACFKAPKDGKPLRKLYSFVENFWGNNGQLYRSAHFGNTWIRRENGEWKPVIKSTFSYDATGKAGDRIDYGGGISDTSFYLWNGGFKNSTTKYGDVYTRVPGDQKPVIDFYKNTDSVAEAIKENALIATLIQTKQFDTTGSTKGIYYSILKEGEGPLVDINDTLVVRYKGQLLNGFVFDQTKETAATFPLKRLIKGWQAGLPMCRKKGTIRLLIPSSLAYSIRNIAVIPPNSILIFDVEVLEIKKP